MLGEEENDVKTLTSRLDSISKVVEAEMTSRMQVALALMAANGAGLISLGTLLKEKLAHQGSGIKFAALAFGIGLAVEGLSLLISHFEVTYIRSLIVDKLIIPTKGDLGVLEQRCNKLFNWSPLEDALPLASASCIGLGLLAIFLSLVV